jgi:hypothetical protein
MDGQHSAKNWLAFLTNAGSLLSIVLLERDLAGAQQRETISQMVIDQYGWPFWRPEAATQAKTKSHAGMNGECIQTGKEAQAALGADIQGDAEGTSRQKQHLAAIDCWYTPADQDRAPGRYVIFQMAEVAVPRELFHEILRLIEELRPQPPPA